MDLYLMRHGIAEDGKPGQPDEERALTEEGIERLKAILQRAREANVRPELILSSPYKRAMQTAEIAKKVLRVADEVVVSDAFVPEASPQSAWDELRLFRDYDSVLITSHNPLCSTLFALLLNSPNLLVDYKKGALAHIEVDQFGPQPHGVLRFFLVAKLVD